MKEEKVIVVDINLTRGLLVLLALALLAAAFLGHLAWNQGEAAASGPQAPPAARQDGPLASSANMRQFYLTKTSYNGAQALAACASGYHMASMWEIVDPSNLKYNTTLGYTMADSGQGPPLLWGWVRTGFLSNNSSTAGLGNCSAWTSSYNGYYGSFAELPWGWLGGLSPPNFDIWYVGANTCDQTLPVWCVEN
jgi:hypothetical protein